jgi:hypothetical protein
MSSEHPASFGALTWPVIRVEEGERGHAAFVGAVVMRRRFEHFRTVRLGLLCWRIPTRRTQPFDK